MNFNYSGYQQLLGILQDGGYAFCNYHHYAEQSRCVILRHDIDTSLEQAVKLGAIESKCGVKSTYFVLLRTEFYNVASAKAQMLLDELQGQGHEVGLHFDEAAYDKGVDTVAAIKRFSSLMHYKEGYFTWVKTQKNIAENFDLSRITIAFVSEQVAGAFPNTIRSAQSKRAFFATMEHFYGQEVKRPAIGQFTYLSPKVQLGQNVRIGHNCTIGGEITIGDDTALGNNVTILNRVSIGENCDIHSGVVIGHDGFAYTENEAHEKNMGRHFGGVTIGNWVLIGENTCISHGTIDDTFIEDGVKIDALGHIAHNCYFGRNSAMAVPCSVSGSVNVGENAYLAGSIVRNQCTIGENAFMVLGAVVVKDVPPDTTVVGNPAKPFERKKD